MEKESLKLSSNLNQKRKRIRAFLALVCFLTIFLSGGSIYYRILPHKFLKNGLRVIASHLAGIWHLEDIKTSQILQKEYWIGSKSLVGTSYTDSWENAKKTIPGFSVVGWFPAEHKVKDIPFIYEKINASQLKKLRDRYDFLGIVEGAGNEYEAMLRLGGWIGTQWDHGLDKVPGGNNLFSVSDVIEAGRNGSKFWCEIAAKATVQAATAMGWPARLVSASRDGYNYDHATTELWSNQFNKWFVIDTDFNFVFESGGIPLSAFELTHEGPELQKSGRLHIRRIAPPKPSINSVDLIPYFRYIHIDLRNDWYSRRLSRGSPAGGDLATWWSARPDLGPLLTAKIEIEDKKQFNWSMNTTFIHLEGIKPASEKYRISVALTGYSPYFRAFLVALDNRPWQPVKKYAHSFLITKGTHTLHARMITKAGDQGPESWVTFQIP